VDYFFVRVVEGKVKLAWCNSRSKAMEFAAEGWRRVSAEEFERLETARIERRLTPSLLTSVLGLAA
jgi:hypothetical protein